jgi:beta-glucanase (GH16 family)
MVGNPSSLQQYFPAQLSARPGLDERTDKRGHEHLHRCTGRFVLPVDLSQFHTYGALWTPGHVSWYFDNRLLNTVETYLIFDDLQQSYYLILGSQEGANWTPGNTSGVSATSIWMQVQWVHVWQREGTGCFTGQ